MERKMKMRGIPRIIQTPDDLDNLFSMYTAGKNVKGNKKIKPSPMVASLISVFDESLPEESKVDEAEFATCLRRLLGQQYHRVRIIGTERNKVTTMYFPEIEQVSKTQEGQDVVDYIHIEAPEDSEERMDAGDGVSYEFTEITLSAAPSDSKWLAVHMPDNQLTRMGFDPAKIQEMLEVLNNA